MRGTIGRLGRTLITAPVEGRDGDVGGFKAKGFFACYLLASLSPRHKGHTYIGFTVNPRRRIRQHNGEIRSGARRTKGRRPWEMVLCIYGFPTHVSALQFEWAWQHPTESLAVRKAAASFKSLSGVPNKIKLAYTMLTLHTWQSMNLTVNFFSTKHMKHAAACPSLPKQMKIQIYSMDDLPCYSGINQSVYDYEDDWDYDGQEFREMGSNNESTQEGVADIVHRSSVNFSDCTERKTDSQLGLQENCSSAEQRDFTWLTDDCTGSLCLIDYLGRGITSVGNNAPGGKISTEGRGMNEDSYASGEVRTDHWSLSPLEQSPAIRVGRGIQSFSREEIEVIDLFTPSPNCRTKVCRKKRRLSAISSEIIDLTKSPMFVQL
ncbi:hypothetical protein Ancab_011693 [Ancistrocladus abbreviatus]